MDDNLTVDLEALQELIAINLPYFASCADAQLLLGGADNIKTAVVKKSSSIMTQMHQMHPLSQLLLGKRHDTSGLIIRMRRKKGDGNPTAMSVDIIGKLTAAYSFKDPADLQFLPQSCAIPVPDVSLLSSMASSSSFANSQPSLSVPDYVLELIPRPFIQTHKKKAERLFVKTQAASKPIDKTLCHPRSLRNVRIGDPIPQPPDGPDSRAHSRMDQILKTKIHATLTELFDKHPVHFRRFVVSHPLLLNYQNFLRDAYHRHAYTYVNGPFKGLLLKLGYDPSLYPESRVFQTLTVRLSTLLYRSLVKRVWDVLGITCHQIVDLDTLSVSVGRSTASDPVLGANATFEFLAIVIFKTRLKQQFSLQICQIADEEVFKYVSTLRRLPEMDEQSGWYTMASLNLLRAHVVKVLIKRIDAFCAAHTVSSSSSHPRTHEGDDDMLETWRERYVALPDLVLPHSERGVYGEDEHMRARSEGPCWDIENLKEQTIRGLGATTAASSSLLSESMRSTRRQSRAAAQGATDEANDREYQETSNTTRTTSGLRSSLSRAPRNFDINVNGAPTAAIPGATRKRTRFAIETSDDFDSAERIEPLTGRDLSLSFPELRNIEGFSIFEEIDDDCGDDDDDEGDSVDYNEYGGSDDDDDDDDDDDETGVGKPQEGYDHVDAAKDLGDRRNYLPVSSVRTTSVADISRVQRVDSDSEED